MTKPNPYEPSQTPIADSPKPLTAKKAMGCLTLLILTPIAVIVTGFASCGAGFTIGQAAGNNAFAMILFVAVSFIPPGAVLVLMIVKGIAAYNRDRK